MFYYINQSCTPSFPAGLVKTNSDFIVRSVQPGLGRWMLVVAVISSDACPFFGFFRSDLLHWGYRNRSFLVALWYLIIRRMNLEVATKSFFTSKWKYWDSLLPFCTWKCAPTAISVSVDISNVPGRHLLQ